MHTIALFVIIKKHAFISDKQMFQILCFVFCFAFFYYLKIETLFGLKLKRFLYVCKESWVEYMKENGSIRCLFEENFKRTAN